VCNRNTTLSADCPPEVTITSSGGRPYRAGDQLTCAYDEGSKSEEDNPTYVWSGTNGGSSFSSTSRTVTLLGGEFCLNCTVTVDVDRTKDWHPYNCSGSSVVCNNASGKY